MATADNKTEVPATSRGGERSRPGAMPILTIEIHGSGAAVTTPGARSASEIEAALGGEWDRIGRSGAYALTLDCGQGAVKLLAEDVEGTADVAFGGKGQASEADALTQAAKKAETNAKTNAEQAITNQQNEVKCGGKCPKKESSKPTSEITSKGTATANYSGADHKTGTARGTAKATGHGTVQCKA